MDITEQEQQKQEKQFLQPHFPIEFNIEVWGLRKYGAMRRSLFGKGWAVATAAPGFVIS